MPPLQVWVGAVQTGCVAALLGLGYLLITKTARVFMFPLGAAAAFGGMFVSWLAVDHGWNRYAAMIAGVIAAAGVVVLADVAVIAPIQHRAGRTDQFSIVVATIGVLFALQQVAGTLFGRQPVRVPWIYDGDTVRWNGASFTPQWISTVVVTLIVFAGMHALIARTSYGRFMRAIGTNRAAAEIIGIPEVRLRAFGFALGGAVAGVGGVLLAGKGGVRFDSSFEWAVLGFIAVIIGGTARVIGPLLGGLVVACIQAFASYRFGPAWLEYVTLALVLLFFRFRPQGLFSTRVRV